MNCTLLRNLFLSSEESRDLAELLAQESGIIDYGNSLMMNYYEVLRLQKIKIRQE